MRKKGVGVGPVVVVKPGWLIVDTIDSAMCTAGTTPHCSRPLNGPDLRDRPLLSLLLFDAEASIDFIGLALRVHGSRHGVWMTPSDAVTLRTCYRMVPVSHPSIVIIANQLVRIRREDVSSLPVEPNLRHVWSETN